MAAAAKVFYERGYSAATVQDIADELGILKGSLYHYIKTKEDLLFRVFEQVHKEVEAILEEVLAVEGVDPLERIRASPRSARSPRRPGVMQCSIVVHSQVPVQPANKPPRRPCRRASCAPPTG